MNFTIALHEDFSFGTFDNQTRSWGGMVGSVARGKLIFKLFYIFFFGGGGLEGLGHTL